MAQWWWESVKASSSYGHDLGNRDGVNSSSTLHSALPAAPLPKGFITAPNSAASWGLSVHTHGPLGSLAYSNQSKGTQVEDSSGDMSPGALPAMETSFFFFF